MLIQDKIVKAAITFLENRGVENFDLVKCNSRSAIITAVEEKHPIVVEVHWKNGMLFDEEIIPPQKQTQEIAKKINGQIKKIDVLIMSKDDAFLRYSTV